MRRLLPRSLLWQLGLALMAVQVIVALALGAYAYGQLKKFHHDQVLQKLRGSAALAAARFEPVAGGAAAGPSQRIADGIAAETGLRVTVVLPDGTVVADTQHDPVAMDNHRYRPEIDRALASGTGSASRFSSTSRDEMVYVATALRDGGGRPVAVVRVGAALAAVDAELGRLVRVVGVAGAFSLAATFAIFLLLSRRLSTSVWRVAQGAARFASGDLTHRIPRPASRELATVAEAFNRMAEELEDRIARLSAQQHEQQAVLDSMSNGVLALDADQTIISTNRAADRMLGLDGRTARGRLLQEAIREPGLNSFVAEALAGRERGGEFQVGHDRHRTVQAAAEPLEDAEGRVAGLLVVLNDVTQLRRLETIRSDFAANVSHELRTPITNIKGYLETILDSDQVPAETRAYLEIVGRSADRLEAIIEDLLALARLEEPNRAQSLKRADTPIADLAESVLATFQPQARDRSIALVARVDPDLRAHVNAQLIEQAVGNLVSNAVKFAPTGTTVTVSARRPAPGVLEIAVGDQGPGIAAHHLPRLFERFYRVDRGRSRELGGTGLGLAIVKHIAMVHGGRAEVESVPGRGSTFLIVVPDANPPARRSGGAPILNSLSAS